MMSATDKVVQAASVSGARAQLERAAIELFQERGYDRTTAAEIAARVGVTERTFFRHFADKREVLFAGETVLVAALTTAVAEVPPELGAVDTLFRAFGSVVPLLESNRAFAEPRQALIARTPALQEREAAKLAVLADVLAAALRARGVAEPGATLAARTGIAAFAFVTVAWLDNPVPGLGARLDDARRALTTLFSDGGDVGRPCESG